MDWMFEWNGIHYAAVVAVTAVCGYLWFKDRSSWSAMRFGICAAILVAIVGLGMVESNGEQCVRKTQEMAAAVAAKDVDKVFVNVTDDFHFKAGTLDLDKPALRTLAVKAMEGITVSTGYGKLESLVVDSFRKADQQPTDGSLVLIFFFKPKGTGIPDVFFGYARGVYRKDAAGEWRLSEMQVFKDAKLTDPMDVPAL